MFTLSTCPIDRNQVEFFGMARYRTRFRPKPVFVRWLECTGCAALLAVNDFGKVLHIRTKPFSKDEIRSLFPRGKQE